MFRRSIFFIFVAVIALQLSWVAVCPYCVHETGSALQYSGQQDQLKNSDDLFVRVNSSPSLVKKLARSGHCSYCHHAPAAIASLHFSLKLRPVSVLASAVIIPLSSTYIPPPERPQWYIAV